MVSPPLSSGPWNGGSKEAFPAARAGGSRVDSRGEASSLLSYFITSEGRKIPPILMQSQQAEKMALNRLRRENKEAVNIRVVEGVGSFSGPRADSSASASVPRDPAEDRRPGGSSALQLSLPDQQFKQPSKDQKGLTAEPLTPPPANF